MTTFAIGLACVADPDYLEQTGEDWSAHLASDLRSTLEQITSMGDLPAGCGLELSDVIHFAGRASFSVTVLDTVNEPGDVRLAVNGLAALFRTMAATIPPDRGVTLDVTDPQQITERHDTDHAYTIATIGRHGVGSGLWYVARCSCGWSSDQLTNTGLAHSAHTAHVENGEQA